MAVSSTAPHVQPRAIPPIRHISAADLRASLGDGWQDFLAMRGDLLFLGLLYPIVGLIAATVSLGGALIPLFFPIAAGIGLLGPLAAVGFYELARRREQGLTSNWSHFLDVMKRPSSDGIGIVSAALLSIFALWVIIAGGLYLLLWGATPPPSIGAFLTRLFTSGEGWALIVAGNLIGAGLGIAVVALSTVSMPMLVDRNVNAAIAVSTSLAAFGSNFAVMLRWALIVAALLVLGSIPAFIGLAVVIPWLGYSTWHLYTRLVDRSVLPLEGANT